MGGSYSLAAELPPSWLRSAVEMLPSGAPLTNATNGANFVSYLM